MTKVAPDIVELVESVLGGAPFKIGDMVRHPDGRLVKIIDGQYWGTHGLSNFWYWREIAPTGELCAEVEQGYGWSVDMTTAAKSVPEGTLGGNVGKIVTIELFRNEKTNWSDTKMVVRMSALVEKAHGNPASAGSEDILRPQPREGTYAMICLPDDTIDTIMDRFQLTKSVRPGDIVKLTFSNRVVSLVIGDPKVRWELLDDSGKPN